MEGDAGAGRLNPHRAEDSSLRGLQVTAEDSAESEAGADQTSTEVTAEDSAESEDEADEPTRSKASRDPRT